MSGTLAVHRIGSRVLKDNPLRDPAVRDLYLYTPPDYNPKKGLPALLALSGFTGTGGSLFNVDPLGEDLKKRLDRLISSGKCPPVIVAAPDCFNRLGGSQYINSSAVGRYEDYLIEEVIPFVESRVAVASWGVFGKSSGGYGSIVLGMRHPEVFRALADHSGDSNFELCYLPDWPAALDEFRAAKGPKRWLERYWNDVSRHRKRYFKPINMLAMSAHYSPNPKSPHLGIDFPFDLETGEFKEEVWKRWQAWDPVRMAAKYARNLKNTAVFIDCGTRDEFALHWGARALAAELRRRGLKPVFEEFDDGHMSIAYRYDRSIPFLAKALLG